MSFISARGGKLDHQKKSDLITDFENLVEEMLKAEPNDNQIKELMEKLNLEYQSDPVQRIAMVLEKMEKIVFQSKKLRKADHDLR